MNLYSSIPLDLKDDSKYHWKIESITGYILFFFQDENWRIFLTANDVWTIYKDVFECSLEKFKKQTRTFL